MFTAMAPSTGSTASQRGWFPYGDYGCVSLLALALSLGHHLDTAPSAGGWAHAICCTPAAAMGLQQSSCGLMARGAPADTSCCFLAPDARLSSWPGFS